MKVILVNEYSHGLLTVAKDYQSAIFYLINNNWIKETTNCYDDETDSWKRLDEIISNPFDTIMYKWDIKNFNHFWNGDFSLYETEVYENKKD